MNKLYFGDNLDILKDLRNEYLNLPHFEQTTFKKAEKYKEKAEEPEIEF